MSATSSSGVVADITGLLERQAEDDRAQERLYEVVYPVLRRLAGKQLRGNGEVVLSVTELVNEASLVLLGQQRVDWRNRGHFFSVAARVMRRVLIDEIRRRRSAKRGGDVARVTLETGSLVQPPPRADLLDLDRALESLRHVDPQAASVAELRAFLGLSLEEVAVALDLGRTTVVRRWQFARAWLHRWLDPPRSGDARRGDSDFDDSRKGSRAIDVTVRSRSTRP